jgi:hypothetical protein
VLPQFPVRIRLACRDTKQTAPSWFFLFLQKREKNRHCGEDVSDEGHAQCVVYRDGWFGHGSGKISKKEN